MTQAREQVGHWLAELGRNQGHSFALDEEGQCFLQGEDEVQLALQVPAQSDHCFLSAPLAPLPERDGEAILLQALTLNLFQAETRGAAIAVDPSMGQFLLCYSLPVEGTTYPDFSNSLSNFAQLVAPLRAQLQAPEGSDPPAEGIPAEGIPAGAIRI